MLVCWCFLHVYLNRATQSRFIEIDRIVVAFCDYSIFYADSLKGVVQTIVERADTKHLVVACGWDTVEPTVRGNDGAGENFKRTFWLNRLAKIWAHNLLERKFLSAFIVYTSAVWAVFIGSMCGLYGKRYPSYGRSSLFESFWWPVPTYGFTGGSEAWSHYRGMRDVIPLQRGSGSWPLLAVVVPFLGSFSHGFTAHLAYSNAYRTVTMTISEFTRHGDQNGVKVLQCNDPEQGFDRTHHYHQPK